MKKWQDKNLINNSKNKISDNFSISEIYRNEILDTRIAVSDVIEKSRVNIANIKKNIQPSFLPIKSH